MYKTNDPLDNNNNSNITVIPVRPFTNFRGHRHDADQERNLFEEKSVETHSVGKPYLRTRYICVRIERPNFRFKLTLHRVQKLLKNYFALGQNRYFIDFYGRYVNIIRFRIYRKT